MFFNFQIFKGIFDHISNDDDSFFYTKYEQKKYYSKFKRRDVEYIDVEFKVISTEFINLDYYIALKFFNSLNKLSKECLFVIQDCYLTNLSYHPYFSWQTAFYLRRKFYKFKKSLLRS